MVMRPTTLILMDGKNIRQEMSLTSKNSGTLKKIKAIHNGKFILADKESGLAPENITVKRVGKDLHIFLEGNALDNPTVIIEDYFVQNAELIGLAENGVYYPYISSEGDNSTSVAATLLDGETSPLVLGGEEDSHHDFFALFAALGIFGASFGTLAALAMKNNSGKGKHSDNAPSDTPDVSHPTADVITPKLSQVIDNQGAVQGAIIKGSATDDNTPMFSGNGGTPGNTVIIYDNGKMIGETIVAIDGSWSFTPQMPLADGPHTITLVEKAVDGTTSAPSGPFDFTVDTVAPATPSITGIYDNIGYQTGWISAGEITDDTRPALHGRAEPGTKIEIYDNGKKLGETQADAKGEWSFTPSADLSDGSHSFTVRATDSAGNVSAPSTAWEIIIGSTDIEVPLIVPEVGERDQNPIDEIIDDEGSVKGPITNGGSTDDTTPTLNGKGEPGDTVIITDGDEKIGEVVVKDDGTWTFTPEPELGEGEHEISVIIKDKDGNESDPSNPWIVIVDTTAPDAPVIGVVIDDVGATQGDLNNGDSTDDAQPTLKGTAEAGSVIAIYDGSTKLGETTAGPNGEWEFTPATDLSEGEHSLTATATDAAGNTSAPSAPWIVDILDTTAPDAPVIGSVTDDVGVKQGDLNNGDSTDDTQPMLKGTAEAGAVVAVYDGSTKLGETTANEDGQWEFTPSMPLAEGEHSLTVTATDAAGNTSAPSAPWDLTVDTTAPAQPGIDGDGPGISGVTDNEGPITGSVDNGGTTDDTTPTFNGTGNPGDTVIITDGGSPIGEVIVKEDGSWEFTPETGLEDGEHDISVIIQDPAGNQSEPSDPWVVIVDTKAPDAPIIGVIIDDVGATQGDLNNGDSTDDAQPTLKGTAEAGSVIAIYDGSTKLGETTAGPNGEWEFTPATDLSEGEHSLTATATDAAGNTSAPSAPWIVDILDTTAPDAPVIGSVTDDVGVKQGDLNNGDSTDDTQPMLKGTAEAGAVVAVYDGSTKLGETTANEDGQWEFTPSTPLTEGGHSLTVTATDAAGNTSAPSAPWDLTVDTTAPAQPGIDGDGPGISGVTDNVAPIAGPVENGGTTDDNTPTFNGTGNPGDTVIITDGGNPIGEVIVKEDGTWEFTPETGLEDGEHDISVIIQDPAGNQSEPSDPWVVIVDTKAPDAPVIGSVTDDVGVKQGDLNNGDSTDDTQPMLKGTAEAGAVVAVYDGSTKLGETTANDNGEWEFTPSTPLTEGEHSLTVTATDAAGNTSAPSAPWELTVDTTAPAQPGIDGDGPGISGVTDNVAPIAGPVENGGTTDDNTPTFNGTGNPGDTVIITDGGNPIGEVIVKEDGTWEFTPETGLEDGEHDISVIIQDPAGNQSEPSDPWVVVVDTKAPAAPVIDVVVDDVGAKQGDLTNGDNTDDTQPTLKGTAEAGSVIAIYDGSTKLGETTVGPDGKWEFTPTTPLQGGGHSLTATATDVAGNTSAPSEPWILDITDTTAPDAPVIGSVTDNVGVKQGDLNNGDSTDDTQPTLKGTAEAGSVVAIYDGSTKIGETTTGLDGKWEFTPSTPLTEGGHSLTVTATDAAGNTSAPSVPWDLTIDTTAPAQPGIDGDGPGISGVTDNVAPIAGPVENGGTTDDNTPTFNGTGNPGDTVIITDGGSPIGEVIVKEDGTWEFTPETGLEDGEHDISVIIQDPAGNQSEPSDPWVVIVDTKAPDAPVIGSVTDDVGAKQGDLNNGDSTDDTQPMLKGTAEAGSVVAIYDGSTKLGETTAGPDGKWEFTPATPLAEGEHTLTITATDAAGNTSAPSAPWELVIDTTAPAQPVIDGEGAGISGVTDNEGPITGPVENGGTTDDKKPTFNGTGEPGDTVIITDGGNPIGEAIVKEDGSWEFTPATDLEDGEHDISVIIQDPAGNQSEPSDPWIVIIDTKAPDAPTIDSVYDDVGSKVGELESGDITDDRQPVLSGRAEAGSTVKIYDQDTQIGSVKAEADGSWTFEVPEDLGNGEHIFSAIAEDKAGNQSEPSSAFEIIVSEGDVPTQIARLSHMGKDSGYDGHDFITDNGDFGRLMYGTLSAELNTGEELQISVDGGNTWQKAMVDGKQWAAQDITTHTASWIIQTRVFDTSTGKSGHVMEQAVTLDTTAATAPSSVRLDGTHLVVEFNPNGVTAGDRVNVVADGGAHRFEHTLTAEDVAAGSVTLDVGSVSTASAALVDQAGNLSGFTNTAGLAPGVNMAVSGDVSEIYGQNRDNIFSVSDVSQLNNVKVIEGNNGIDTLKLTGADQVLDLSGWQGRLSSVEIIDITGSGDNTLKISLGDVLDQGYANAFSAADEGEVGNVQLAVKGNKGDVVVLNDLLPNGMDVGHWENLGEVTSAGIKYDLYQHSGMNADILIQQDVDVQFH